MKLLLQPADALTLTVKKNPSASLEKVVAGWMDGERRREGRMEQEPVGLETWLAWRPLLKKEKKRWTTRNP